MQDMQKSIERIQKSMELDRSLVTAMMTITARRADDALIASLEDMDAQYYQLLRDTPEDEQLLTPQALREKLADLKDCYGRALEVLGRTREAIAAFEMAASMFDEAGKPSQASQSRNKAAELQMDIRGDFDQEVQRLQAELQKTNTKSLDRAEVLVRLGELHGKANDDFEAVRYLEQALKDYTELRGNPSDGDMVNDLFATLGAISEGKVVAGHSPIEMAVRRRTLGQRLLLALANAYRTTNPTKAAEIENKLRGMVGDKDTYLAGLIGSYLDHKGDVTKFLADLSRKGS